MPSADFKERIKSALTKRTPEPAFREAVQSLREAAAAIQDAGIVSDAEVRVEPGHLVNLGQQFNMVLTIPSRNFRDVLFRAYVPMDGYPVNLDFFGETPVPCPDQARLESEIVRFLSDRNVNARLQMIA
jgi:hypothetical protein